MKNPRLKDHRQIGRDLDLFSFHQYAPGAVFWHPKGWLIYQILQNFIREKTAHDNYQEISTPVMVKSQLFKKSGHWQHFGENIFTLNVDGENYSLKPMNCPESTIVYSSKIRSYHDLPIKLSEFGILHRKELSGVLGGTLRVRQFVIDDAHLFVRTDQIQQEIRKLIDLTCDVYKVLDFKPKFYLATRPDKAMGDKKTWDKAEHDLQEALTKAKVHFQLKPKDGAFYGPKIDIHIEDSQKRDWQLATIQLDFQIPQSMNLGFINKKGQKEKPVMIHRGIFGSIERFIGILLEHTQGNLPTWLAPIQAIILPITDKHLSYAQEISSQLIKDGIRLILDSRNETLQAKIRDAALQKIPYQLIIGDEEIKDKKIAVRTAKNKDLGKKNVSDIICLIQKNIA
ncbi:threonine--tRNA ligase [Candidatus Curtissbacteria bacterium RBG_13_35_7]|uniref:Threonine--tRNA ligase n=1 Tax=Candidatus Curtissbacteria bacterium RBG_13_35_7 TaxID=1797705 RepID=A0A1F5G477_9BACT|nr:MAG: threonine--tRNA ligase [Candidatus Curtissbacteria bacterium RBG_13_35_7]